MQSQRHQNVSIRGDVPTRLQALDSTSIDLGLLDAPIRGLGAASAASHCRATESGVLLTQFLDVQRRAMLSHKDAGWSVDHRGTHALIAARAFLDRYTRDPNPKPVLDHLDVLREDAELLSGFLHGLAGCGAENERRAEAARDLWPKLLEHALSFANQDRSPYGDPHWGDWAAAALLPEPLSWTHGLYNEVVASPIEWVNAEDLLGLIDSWIALARGKAKCVDALIRLLQKLPETEQVTHGLTWVISLLTSDGQVTIKQTRFSNDWLKEVRSPAEQLDMLGDWQRIVDAMVVAGNEGLAPYSR